MFSFFKRKKKEPKNNLGIGLGDKVSFNRSQWEVTDEFEYNWANDSKDLEFELKNQGETVYLGYSLSFSEWSEFREAAIKQVMPSIGAELAKGQKPPDSFQHDGDDYQLVSNGNAIVKGSNESFGLENYYYKSKKRQRFASINIYEDQSYDLYLGKTITKAEFTVIE